MMSMKVAEGMTPIDADVLARAFEVSLDDLQRHMREGKITSHVETGEHDDVGKVRLTFLLHDRQVLVTADEHGRILTCDTARTDRPTSPVSRESYLDALLDEALDASFPVSDPIAISFEAPHRTIRSSKRHDDG